MKDVLNYEGGGLSIRMIANYDGIKWMFLKIKLNNHYLLRLIINYKSYTGHNMSATINLLIVFLIIL